MGKRDVMKEDAKKLDEMRREALLGGGPEKLKRRRKEGKLTARERIDLLLDPGSFQEVGMFVTHRCHDFGMAEKQYLGDGVVTGYGTVHDRLVYVVSEDFTVLGGALSQAYAEKIRRVQDLALKNGAPIVSLKDSGGARIQEGVDSLAGYGRVFMGNVRASGVVPQISAVLGPCAGGASYSPALTDFIFMVRGGSNMFLTGPEVVKAVTQEEVGAEELGGGEVHAAVSGVAHFLAPNDRACLARIKDLLSYLPQNNLDDPPVLEWKRPAPLRRTLAGLMGHGSSAGKLAEVVPDDPSKPYDMRRVVEGVADEGSFLEVHENFAPNLIVGFARMEGRTVGMLGNQPLHLAGVLDAKSAGKGARFVRFCDCFNIPLVVFEDAPGFLPGVEQEHSGVIREGAKLLYAFCEATVPRITVTVRKAYGGAYIALNSKQIGADFCFAWPTAQIAVMGAPGAVGILHRKRLAAEENPESLRARLVAEYEERFSNPYVAARRGYVDEVIKPEETRDKLLAALASLQGKRDRGPAKKHGNLPL